MTCPKCGKELPEGSAFCPACGIDEIGLFVGKNADYYKPQFRKFDLRGTETFAVTWNWAACFCNFWWFLYRKLYLWALVWFLLTLIPFFGFAFWIAAGITGNYLYYKHANARIREAKSMQPADQLPTVLKELGGVNQWVITLGVIVTIILFILALLFGIGAGLFYTLARKGTWT